MGQLNVVLMHGTTMHGAHCSTILYYYHYKDFEDLNHYCAILLLLDIVSDHDIIYIYIYVIHHDPTCFLMKRIPWSHPLDRAGQAISPTKVF